MITAYNGIRPTTGTAPDPGFGKASHVLRLPLIMRNYSLYGHTRNTTIHIQNASPATAYVYVYFYWQDGSWEKYDGPYTIQPGASIKLDQADDEKLGEQEGFFIGTAMVYSVYQRPVVAIVNEVNT